MGGRNKMGYRGYQGRRRGGSTALKILVAVLAVLVVAGILFMVFLGKYVEYTDDGVRLHLPWLQSQESEPPQVSDPVVIITDEPATPSPGGEEENSLPALNAAEVTVAQLTDGTAQALLDGGQVNALVVEVKAPAGALAWKSQSALAASMGVNGGDDGLKQALDQLSQREEKPWMVARINCFRDQAMAVANLDGGVLMTRGGNRWYDPEGLCWISPVSQQAREYLIDLCLELAQMGFDEIVLDNCGYPEEGEVNVLAVSDNRPEDLTEPVNAFWRELAQALADTDVTLSAAVSGEALLGTNQLSGVTPAMLAQMVDRVWVNEAAQGTDYASPLEQAGMDDAQSRLVLPDTSGEQNLWTTPQASPAA